MFAKLKREWKTFGLSIASIAVGVWEGARELGYDLAPIIPEKYRPFVIPGIGISFLILRQWRDVMRTTVTVETETETKTTETVKEKE